jgi:RecJ-like exonuclease
MTRCPLCNSVSQWIYGERGHYVCGCGYEFQEVVASRRRINFHTVEEYDEDPCRHCRGTKKMTVHQGIGTMAVECPRCHGTGLVVCYRCADCGRLGYEEDDFANECGCDTEESEPLELVNYRKREPISYLQVKVRW